MYPFALSNGKKTYLRRYHSIHFYALSAFMGRFQGIIGVVLILGIAFLFSNNRKKINYRLVFSGIGLQVFIGLLVFKVPPITWFFRQVGDAMGKLESFARTGAAFVYGGIGATQPDGSLKDYAAGGFVFRRGGRRAR